VPSPTTLLLFAGSTLLVLAVPGPSVLYVVARTIEHGRAAGLVSVLGLEAGALVHVAAAAAGLSALLASSPTAFAVLHYGGAAYLLWLAIRALRRGVAGAPAAQRPAAVSHGRLFRDGALVDVLNPKTSLFFLAFLPGFVHEGHGPVALQVIVLGLAFVALATLTDGAYALVAARFSRGVRRGSTRGLARASAGAYWRARRAGDRGLSARRPRCLRRRARPAPCAPTSRRGAGRRRPAWSRRRR
jgi:threonine/homoserine/homoserine lactone efflux protein